MDIRKVKKLIELLEQSKVSEIEIKEGEESVRISRQASPPPAPSPVSAPPATGAAPSTATPAPSDTEEVPGHMVRSPMVGIYYASPKPDSPPFVEEGSSVAKGDPLCIIEAMKVMNHIEAPTSGTVKKVFAKNGEPVQYDEALFVID